MRDVAQYIPEEERTQETITELDSEIRQRVAAWSRQWLDNFYNQGSPSEGREDFRAKLDFAHALKAKIAEMVGETNSFSQGLLALRYREGVGIFLNALIDFVAEKSSDPKNAPKLRNFIGGAHEMLFSLSPNIANQIGMENLLITTAKANRVPEAQGWFGQNMVGEMAYELAFCSPEAVERIAARLQQLPVAEKLDVLAQLETVAADAVAQGDWAQPVAERVRYLIEQMTTNHDSPIIQYSSELAVERIAEEEENPSLGVVTFHGNKQGGRLNRGVTHEQRQQHTKLAGQINPDIAVDGTILPIASDAVAIFDHSQIPRHMARVKLEALPVSGEISIVALRNALATCRDPRRLQAEDLINLLSFINDRVVIPDRQSWAKISDRLNAQDWDEFFTAKQSFEALKQRYNQALYSGVRESYSERELWQEQEGYALREAADKIAVAYPIIRPELVRYLQGVEKRLAKQLAPAHFESYSAIPQDTNLNPFAGKEEEDLALLLQRVHQPELRQKIEVDLQIDLRQIPLRSQIHLLRFLAGQDRAGFDRLRGVLQKYPENANRILNSFLAVAEDMHYSEAILKLAESLDQKTADAVYSKYLEIVAATEQIRQLTTEQTNEVIRNLLHKSNELLRVWAAAAEKQDTNTILDQLEHIKAEILLFASTFKVLSNQSKIELTDLAGARFDIKLSGDLTDAERRQMQRIFAENRQGYSSALFKETTNEFDSALHTANQEFQILCLNDEVLAFIRFDRLPNGNLYAGSLNVRPEARGSAIGSAMLQAALDRKAQEHNIEAVAYSQNPMLKHYTSDFGFQIAGEIPNYNGTGELFYKLFRPRQERAQIARAA